VTLHYLAGDCIADLIKECEPRSVFEFVDHSPETPSSRKAWSDTNSAPSGAVPARMPYVYADSSKGKADDPPSRLVHFLTSPLRLRNSPNFVTSDPFRVATALT